MRNNSETFVDVEGLRDGDLWNHLFGPLHEPALKLTSKSGFKVGSFPTRKGRGRFDLIQTRDEIVHDFLYLAETDFDIVKIVAFPMRVAYWIGDAPFTHVADLGLGHRDGGITFVDVRRYGDIVTNAGAIERAAIRSDHYASQHGCTYVMHDERKVYPEPLFSNAKEMCHIARPQGRLPAYGEIRNAILRMRLPMTIHEIMQASHFNAMTWRYADEPAEAGRVLSEINPVYEIVLELVDRGDLWIDEARAFDLDSMVYFTEFAGIHRGPRFDHGFLLPQNRQGVDP
ncbi:hypothetical protein HW571_21345 [Agrobacterium genomosp. 3]|uniref:hypothetical protein n=1 Tax=Agrobacterium tomkonis TaxID=1183410 RepID=UPI001CD8BD25|nr:hypothetical protein [Agrobacterium tomkonis]MCA1878577.1 hypothetical protein [Agrobacterium tumefaciens]MCA1893802.1 hypothetical protein [Agrobacterium tomkonis]